MEQKARESLERSNLYGLFSIIFKEEATSQLLERMRNSEISKMLGKSEIQLYDMPENEILLKLAVEYTMLFLGPGKHISPHESVHREGKGLLYGDSTLDVKKFYKNCDFVLSPIYKGMPDHIAVELEFMKHLANRESTAWKEGDRDKAMKFQRMQKRFLSEHLNKWAPAFCEKVEMRAELSFYKGFARLTKQFIESEI